LESRFTAGSVQNLRPDTTLGTRKNYGVFDFSTRSRRIGLALVDIEEKRDEASRMSDECKLLCIMR